MSDHPALSPRTTRLPGVSPQDALSRLLLTLHLRDGAARTLAMSKPAPGRLAVSLELSQLLPGEDEPACVGAELALSADGNDSVVTWQSAGYRGPALSHIEERLLAFQAAHRVRAALDEVAHWPGDDSGPFNQPHAA